MSDKPAIKPATYFNSPKPVKYAHSIKLSVFCKENEDENAIVSGLKSLFPSELASEIVAEIEDGQLPRHEQIAKIELQKTTATGFNERKINIYEVNLVKPRHIRLFLENLMKKLGEEQRKTLQWQLHSRLDDENYFFIRLLKSAVFQGKYELTDTGECYHVRISIAAYPNTRQAAVEAVKKIIDIS